VVNGSEVITAEDLKAARRKSGLTQSEAAKLVYTVIDNWQNWEQGRYPMLPALYELFLFKTGLLTLRDVVPGAEDAVVRRRLVSRGGRNTATMRQASTQIPTKPIRGLDINGHMGTRIRTLREARGLTQTDLAMAVGVTKAAVSAWETGYSANIKLKTFLRVLEVLGVSKPESLIRGMGRVR
jgi:transcriptional regulator with XRE-family HTH domain